MDSVSFITNLSEESQKWLMRNMVSSIFDPEQIIVVKGKKNDRLYIIDEGKIGVSIGNKFDVFISELGPGRIVGEVSFLDHNDKAGATLVAIEKSKVNYISFKKIHEHMDNSPTFAADFYRALSIFIARKLKKVNHL